jgi:hypothetical protein
MASINSNRQDLAYTLKVVMVLLFGMAMAYVEAAVVVYLRELFYAEGFSMPMKMIPREIIHVEVVRELATIVMLGTVAFVAGRRFWERFGYFIILFGIWDIFYYIWLRVTIGWPMSLTEWDVLFLIPLPWIGPVIAPVLIAMLMIVGGVFITRLYNQGYFFKPLILTWILWIAATAAILYSFMYDTDATIHLQVPQPYLYSLLFLGLALYVIGFIIPYRRVSRHRHSRTDE